MARALGLGFLILVVFLVSLSSFAVAQIDVSGGDTSGEVSTQSTYSISSSVPPANGFAQFNATCSNTNVSWQQLVVCSGSNGACTPTSSSLLCASPFANSTSFSCTGLVQNQVGVIPYSASCCNLQSNCTSIPVSNPLVVGVSSNDIAGGAILTSEFKMQHLLRTSNSTLIAAVMRVNGMNFFTSMDNGQSWSNSINFLSMISSTNLPSGESGFTISQVDYSTSSVANGILFVVRGNNSGNSALFFSQCSAASSCILPSNWSTPTPVLNPLLTTSSTTPSLFTHAFSGIDLAADAVGGWHVVFYDALLGPQRIPGIFHYSCSSNCSTTNSWKSPTNFGFGSDITHGLSQNAAFPQLASAQGRMHAIWQDNGQFYYSSFDSAMGNWSWNQGSNSNMLLSFVAATALNQPFVLQSVANSLFFLVRELSVSGNGKLSAYTCSVAVCDTQSNWIKQSSFDRFSGEDIGKFGLSFTNGNLPFLAIADLDGSDNLHHLFSFHSGWDSVSLMDLTVNGFNPISRIQSIDARNQFNRVDFMTIENGTAKHYAVSGITAAANTSPSIALSPPPASSWNLGQQSTATAVPTLTQTFTFTARDPEAVPFGAQGLYALIGLGNSPGTIQFPLTPNLDLFQLQGSSSPNSTCTGGANGGFVVQRTCTVAVTLISPTSQLLIPDGTYFLTGRLMDSFGAFANSNGGSVLVNLSNGQFTLISPTHGQQFTQSILPAGDTGNGIRFLVQNPLFAHSLHVQLKPSGQSVSPASILYPINVLGVVNPNCQFDVAANSYACGFPLNNSVVPENLYDFDFELLADGQEDGNGFAQGVLVDLVGPTLVNASPTGSLSSFPSSGTFSLVDFSGIENVFSVTVNGNPVSFQCPGSGVNSLDCSFSFAGINPAATSNYVVAIQTSDGIANDSSPSYSFSIPSGTQGPGGPGGTPGGPGGGGSGGGGGGGGGGGARPGSIANVTENGNIEIIGTPIVVPRTIVESIRRFSNGIREFASDLVEVTGPSATAIFIGICTLAGVASDSVYRKMFNQVKSADLRRKELLVRATLAGIFSLLPLGVGLGVSLALGLIFVVLEFVGFAGGWFIIQNLQRTHAFGFTPVASVAGNGKVSGDVSPPASTAPAMSLEDDELMKKVQ